MQREFSVPAQAVCPAVFLNLHLCLDFQFIRRLIRAYVDRAVLNGSDSLHRRLPVACNRHLQIAGFLTFPEINRNRFPE